MTGLKIFNLVIWLIAGVMNLCSKKIDKFSYAIMWIVLMVYLIDACLAA